MDFKLPRSIKRQQTLLLCPGPVMLAKEVIRATTNSILGHRESEFSDVLRHTTELLKPVLGINKTDQNYSTIFVSGSGTAANETVLSSIGGLGRMLIISNGEFGERLLDLATIHYKNIDSLHFDWGKVIDLKLLDQQLKQKRYSTVAVVHHETSTGMLNPICEITKIAHNRGARIFVDAVSSIGAEKIQMSHTAIDVLVGTSGKALGAMPGVGIVVAKRKLMEDLKNVQVRSHYLNLRNYHHYMESFEQTPNTPVVNVLMSLYAALSLIDRCGIDTYQKGIRHRAQITRGHLSRLHLPYRSYGKHTSSVLTCVDVPSWITYQHIADHFKAAGIVIYGGKGVYNNRIFQVGHIGALTQANVRYSMRVLKQLADIPHSDYADTTLKEKQNAVHA